VRIRISSTVCGVSYTKPILVKVMHRLEVHVEECMDLSVWIYV